MNKVVFFTDLQKLSEALNNFNMESFADKRVPVKLHMGEIKNKFFTKPDFVKLVVDELKKVHADPFLFDTTVAYPGLRHYVSGYQQVARLHGYTMKKIGCDIIIDDSGIVKTVENRDFEVAWHLTNSSHIFAISHVKGHIQTGFGGAIKNFGMGGVTKETKRKMHHGSRPIYQKDACTFCGVCAELCPFEAISIKGDKWKQNMRSCFGCGVCVENCKSGAMKNTDADIQFLITCSAKACVEDKNVLYLNEIKRIARGCDCDPFAAPIICPDIGYVLSDDIVAVDKASLDLINSVKKDVFIKHNKVDPMKQIKYGEEIGLGSSSYQLIEL
ncbi:MAG: DUF362 domain-containing protein [Euryarchaeota archaeon]|nr:DUF362 domain-containing protein [Euryarchaeota archaeon]